MTKTSTFLIFLSLLLIIPATISSAEEQSAKTMVANYLNNGGEMIIYSEDGSKELNLLEHFQGLSKLYQGEVKTQDIKQFSNISYCTWLTMLPLNYTHLVEKIFIHKYGTFKEMMVSNTFHCPQELLNMLKKHVSFQGIGELYTLKADKKLQKTYPMGYLLILLLKSLVLFNFYQTALIKFDITQHVILIAIAFVEYAYFELIPSFVLYDFFDISQIISALHIANFGFMCYSRSRRIDFVSFIPDIINLIFLGWRLRQHKKRYDACNHKIYNMTIQGIKCNKMVDELQGTMQLLHNHQNTVLACYQGKFFNKISGVDDDAKTTLKDVGSIIAQHIDPSIKPDHIALNLLTDENENSDNDYEHDGASCFDNCCGRAMNIIVPSCFWTACLGVFIQRYFSS